MAVFDGSVYYLNDSNVWTAATGSQAANVDTGRAVYAAAYLGKVYIFTGASRPFVFDYELGTVEVATATAGTWPVGLRFGAVWSGALWSAGEPTALGALYASRIGDAHDYDFGTDPADEGKAWFTGLENFEGLLQGPLTAIMPHTNDGMIVGTLTGLTRFWRHPSQGGTIDPVSNAVVLGQGAWTRDPSDNMYLLTDKGFMHVSPDPNAIPTLISKRLIPNELQGLIYDQQNPVVSLGYEGRWNKIIVNVRGVEAQSWAYDIALGGFERQEFSSYPYVLCDFPPFHGETTSGLLWGGAASRPLARFDAFGTETFTARQIAGPVKIARNACEKSKVQSARVVFHSDTPNGGSGVLRFSTGTDGEDAINRLLIGDNETRFTESLDTLAANNGVCHPMIAGSALAVEWEITGGHLAYEETTVELHDAGSNRMTRSTPIPVVGGPVTFDSVSNDFDDEVWGGYVELQIQIDPDTALSGFSHWIDLSEISDATFWANVSSTGGDIRATDGSNNPLPLDLVHFNKSNQTGFAVVKLTATVPAGAIRLWAQNANASLPAANNTYGQYNAYDANYIAFYPDGQGNDRTGNLNHLTHTGLPNPITDALVTGPIGVSATNYRHVDTSNNYGVANAVVPATYPVTLISVASLPSASTIDGLGIYTAAGGNEIRLQQQRASGPDRLISQVEYTGSTSQNGTSTAVTTNVDGWHHYAGVATSDVSRAALLDGANKGTDTDSSTISGIDEIVVGKGSRSATSSSSFLGNLCLCQIHNAARSDTWIEYQWSMLDQAAFYQIGNWQQVNEPEPAPDPDDTACPVFPVNPTEVGTWAGYVSLTADVAPSVALPDYTHLIDLANFPADFWTNVLSSGQDIRVTNDENVFLPFDLIAFNKTAETGLLAVKYSALLTPSEIRVWVGNASAVSVGVCASYGRYSTYDQYWYGFWPDGSGNDRTQKLNHLTARPSASPPTATATGPIGNSATTYDGVGDYCIANTNNLTATPMTMVAAVKQPTDTNTSDKRAIMGATSNILEYRVDDERYATYQYNRTGGAFTAADAPNPSTWRLISGHIQTQGYRRTYIDGDAASFDSDVLPASPYSISGSDATVIGATLIHDTPGTKVGGAAEDSINVLSPFYGDISLASIHQTFRSQAWAEYFAAMLDQSTFWGGAWTWNADSNALPQP